jgi:hypothetical protein
MIGLSAAMDVPFLPPDTPSMMTFRRQTVDIHGRNEAIWPRSARRDGACGNVYLGMGLAGIRRLRKPQTKLLPTMT